VAAMGLRLYAPNEPHNAAGNNNQTLIFCNSHNNAAISRLKIFNGCLSQGPDPGIPKSYPIEFKFSRLGLFGSAKYLIKKI
jgi:hypothetical protein